MTYYTHAQIINNFWKPLCDAHPTVASCEMAGYTYLDNPIWIFKIGNPNGGRILFDGCMHGWEDMGSWVAYQFADWLLNSNDPKANQILRENYWLFVPVLNYDSTGRGNANYTICPSYGVDLNRNFVYNWQYINACGNTNNGIYGCVSGPPDLPHSEHLEAEAQVMKSLMDMYKPTGSQKAVYINSHYGGGPWIHYTGNNLSSFWTPTRTRILELWTNGDYGCLYPYLGATSMGSYMPTGVSGAAAGGSSGDAAYLYGYNAFTVETYARNYGVPCCGTSPCGITEPTWAEMINCISPVYRAMFIAVSEAVAVPVSTPSCSANGPYFANTQETIQFTGTAMGGTAPYTYSWAFGDGQTSTQQNPTHHYSLVGEYIVTLTVTDSINQTASCSTTASISTLPSGIDDSISFTINVTATGEDFNGASYEKNNTPPGSFTCSSNQIDATGMMRASTCYIRKDFSAGHFNDFLFNVDMRCTQVGSSVRQGVAMTNTSSTLQQALNSTDGLAVYFENVSGSLCLILRDCTGSYNYATSIALSTGIWYYLTLQRTGNQLLLSIYSDHSRAAQYLLQQLTVTIYTQKTYRYLYPLFSYGNTTPNTNTMDMNIANLIRGA